MNKRKTFIFSILLCTVSLLTLNIGTASFLYFDNSSTSSEDVQKNESEPVAYIKEDTSKTYYLDIEEAIDDANSMVNSGASAATIVVMPGSVVRLNQNKTLRSGVDLLLPYSLDNGDINKLTTDVNAGNGFYPIRYMYGTTYEGTTNKPVGDFATYAEYNTYSSGNFSDSSSSNITKYLSSSLIIEENVSLTISSNSQLVVFSQLGKPSSGISGHSSGYYSQVIMMENSSINVNEGGIIDCRGYIKEGFKEDPSINVTDKRQITNNSVINNNGTIYSPFVIYDFAGGNATVAIYTKANECPFSSYDMPQIHPKINVSYSGSLKGRADVYTGPFTVSQTVKDLLKIAFIDFEDVYSQHNACVISFCGSDANSIFKLDSLDTSLINKYSPDAYYKDNEIGSYYGLTKSIFSLGRQANNGGSTLLSFNGNVSTNYLTMNISALGKNVPITTNGIFFPLGYNYTLQFENGTVYFNNDIKFMPGSELNLSNVNLNVANKIVFYDESFDDATSDTSPASLKYPKSKSASCLIENTEIKIQGNGAFCGYIETNGNSIIDNLTANVSTTSTNSCDGTLSMDKITDIGLGGVGPLLDFLRDGTWVDETKSTIAKLVDRVTTKNITSTIKADLNSENNVTDLEADSTYIAEDGLSYFTEKEVVIYNINVKLEISLGYNLIRNKSLTIKLSIYKDITKSSLITSTQLKHDRNAASVFVDDASTTLPLTIPEGEKYYVEITTVASSNASADTILISKDNAQAVEKVSNTAFYLDDLTTNYTVRVEG